MSEGQAEELKGQARRKANSFWLFNSSERYEEAANLYIRAAAQYKILQKWPEAAEAFDRAAKMSSKAGNESEYLSYQLERAKCCKRFSVVDASKIYRGLIDKQKGSRNFMGAAKLSKELGEMLESDAKSVDAANAYQVASDLYFYANANTSANEMLIKVADFESSDHNFQRAIALYEKIAQAYAENNLTRWNCPALLLKAALCRLAMCAAHSLKFEKVFGEIKRYREQNALFDGSREAQFLQNLEDSILQNDMEKIKSIIDSYDQYTRLDSVKADLLAIVRRELVGNMEEEEKAMFA